MKGKLLFLFGWMMVILIAIVIALSLWKTLHITAEHDALKRQIIFMEQNYNRVKEVYSVLKDNNAFHLKEMTELKQNLWICKRSNGGLPSRVSEKFIRKSMKKRSQLAIGGNL